MGIPVLELPQATSWMLGSVHFVAQAPVFDAEGFLKAIGTAQITVLGAAGEIAVFHQIPGILHTPCAQIHGHHNLGAGPAGPFLELVNAHLVGFDGGPGLLHPTGPVFLGTGAVLPVVAGNKIAPGVADHGNPELAHQLQHIRAEAHIIGCRVLRVIDPAVHRPAQMLQEGAVDSSVNISDGEMAVCKEFCFHCSSSFGNGSIVWYPREAPQHFYYTVGGKFCQLRGQRPEVFLRFA